MMTPAVHPITLEVYNKKSNDISKNGVLYMENGNFTDKPAVGNDSDTDTQNIFYHIGDAAAEAGNTIEAADYMQSLSPLHDFFNKEKDHENGDSYVQQFAVSFHMHQ